MVFEDKVQVGFVRRPRSSTLTDGLKSSSCFEREVQSNPPKTYCHQGTVHVPPAIVRNLIGKASI